MVATILVALVLILAPDLVVFDARTRSIGVHKLLAIGPGVPPRAVINQDDMVTPSESAGPPAPRRERSNRNPRAEPDRSAHHETGPRPRKDHIWIVVRHVVHARTDRNDFDIAGARHLHALIRTAPQIAVIIGLLAHALNSIHHSRTLGEHSIPEFLCPSHVPRHVTQHVREWKQRDHALVPGKTIVLN